MLEPKIPDNEQERLQDLKDLEILDTADEASFNRITLIAKEFFDVDIVAISLIDIERQWFKSIQGLDVKQTPRDISFCGHAILEHDVFIVSDAVKDQRFSDNPLVTGEPKIRFYAGAQLVSPRGNNVGTLCIINKKPKKLNVKQKQFLKDLASWVELKLNFKRFGMVFNELKNSQARLELATQSAQIGVWEWNIKTNALIWDARMYQLYGIKEQNFSGAYDAWVNGVHPDDRKQAADNLQQAQHSKKRFNTEFRVVWPDQSVRYIRAFGQVDCDETGASDRVIGVNWDITLQKEQEQKIQQLIHSDDLTGLYNRRGFRALAEQKMKEAVRLKQDIVVFLIDIDEMKLINDNFGHKAGDQALIGTAGVLKKTFREMDIICRWGGDEFIIIAVNAQPEEYRLAVIKTRLEDNLRSYNAKGGQKFKLSLSMGEFNNTYSLNMLLDELIQQADKAMYRQKTAGKK